MAKQSQKPKPPVEEGMMKEPALTGTAPEAPKEESAPTGSAPEAPKEESAPMGSASKAPKTKKTVKSARPAKQKKEFVSAKFHKFGKGNN